MQIKIISLSLLNFKGIRALNINFDHITNISGKNRLGKTTIKDGFLWLFFGKDSTDRKDFSIKTLDTNNQPYHRLDHEVTGVLEVDGDRVTIRRLLQEDWVAKRGSKEKEFKGHVTSYYWNDVPMKLEQYQGKIAEIINENLFKLLTNTDYFNGLKWQDRRKVLMDIAGVITNEEVLDRCITPANKDRFTELINALNSKKTLDEYKREISASKKKITDEMELIPGRIDEASRSLPEPMDYDAIQTLLDAAKHGLTETESLLMNKTQAQRTRQQQVTEWLKEVQQLERDKELIKTNIANHTKEQGVKRMAEINELALKEKTLSNDLNLKIQEWTNADTKLKDLQTAKEDVGKEWDKVNAEKLVFDDNDFHCPACKREFEAGTVTTKKQELTNNFNQNKSRRLTDITNRGQQLASEIATTVTLLANLKTSGDSMRAELNLLTGKINGLREAHTNKNNEEQQAIDQAIAKDLDIIKADQQIQELNQKIDAPAPGEDNAALLQTKSELTAKITGYNNQLATKSAKERAENRIKELTDRESTLGGELADLEGIEFSIEEFAKAKMDELYGRLNGRFRMVRFKLFEKQINGGEVECCETLIDGVPFQDANTASKINAGIDIINTLSDHYKVSAPVFVDNAESVNTLIPLNSQLIRLVVSMDDKLKIETSAA